jgi:hypothetical protein
MKVTTVQVAGLWVGQIDGVTVAGPYLNKGMATRQANRIKRQRVEARDAAVDGLPAGVTMDAATGALDGDTDALKALYRAQKAAWKVQGQGAILVLV